jgi:hypothetical protein
LLEESEYYSKGLLRKRRRPEEVMQDQLSLPSRLKVRLHGSSDVTIGFDFHQDQFGRRCLGPLGPANDRDVEAIDLDRTLHYASFSSLMRCNRPARTSAKTCSEAGAPGE